MEILGIHICTEELSYITQLLPLTGDLLVWLRARLARLHKHSDGCSRHGSQHGEEAGHGGHAEDHATDHHRAHG
jgi:hypothetical protein